MRVLETCTNLQFSSMSWYGDSKYKNVHALREGEGRKELDLYGPKGLHSKEGQPPFAINHNV